jgi:hypothetical protein
LRNRAIERLKNQKRSEFGFQSPDNPIAQSLNVLPLVLALFEHVLDGGLVDH